MVEEAQKLAKLPRKELALLAQQSGLSAKYLGAVIKSVDMLISELAVQQAEDQARLDHCETAMFEALQAEKRLAASQEASAIRYRELQFLLSMNRAKEINIKSEITNITRSIDAATYDRQAEHNAILQEVAKEVELQTVLTKAIEILDQIYKFNSVEVFLQTSARQLPRLVDKSIPPLPVVNEIPDSFGAMPITYEFSKLDAPPIDDEEYWAHDKGAGVVGKLNRILYISETQVKALTDEDEYDQDAHDKWVRAEEFVMKVLRQDLLVIQKAIRKDEMELVDVNFDITNQQAIRAAEAREGGTAKRECTEISNTFNARRTSREDETAGLRHVMFVLREANGEAPTVSGETEE